MLPIRVRSLFERARQLLAAQCDERIDGRRAPRGNVRRERRDDREREHHRGESRRIERLDSEQHPRQVARADRRAYGSAREAVTIPFEPLAGTKTGELTARFDIVLGMTVPGRRFRLGNNHQRVG